MPPEFGQLTRPFRIEVALNIGNIPHQPLILSGICRSHLATSTTVLHFGESNVRGRSPVSRWLTVTADTDTAFIRAVADGPSVRVGAVERHGNGWRVQLTPDHANARGRFETVVRFDAVDRAGAVIGFSRVAVDGVVRDHDPGPEGVPCGP